MSLFDIYYYTDKVSFLDVQFSNCGEKEKNYEKLRKIPRLVPKLYDFVIFQIPGLNH